MPRPASPRKSQPARRPPSVAVKTAGKKRPAPVVAKRAKSKSNGGNRTFTITHASGSADARTCTPSGGGCNGSSW